jgi:serine/threonine-protein kinase
LLEAESDLLPDDVSGDGKWLLYEATQSQSGSDLYLLSLEGEGEPQPVATTRFRELEGRISPDGRWISYVSNETGRWELYITRFPGGSGRKWQVSTDGAFANDWAPDSGAIHYKWDDETVMQVSISEKNGEPLLGSPRPVMQVPHTAVGRSLGRFDVGPQGRVLAADSEEYIDAERLSLILNWQAD